MTFDSGLETRPSLAPKGEMFVFVKAVEDQLDIFLQRVNGRSAINLTSDSRADDSQPAFSPDGGLIAFRSERDGGGIFIMGATGESVRRLTASGYDPAWSPDGRQIVFAAEQTDTPRIRYNNKDLHVVDLATGSTRLLYAGDAMQPQWSPGGNRIAFWATDLGGRRDIYTVDSAGRPESVVAVTADDAMDWNPVWLPDGKHLYFSSDRDGTMTIWRIGIDEQSGRTSGGAEPVRTPSPDAGFLSLAANGGQLLYQSTARTGELLRLTFDPATERFAADPQPLFSGSMPIRHVAASPDGKSIGFTSAGAQEDLFVLAADGTGLRQLTSDAARDRGVVWSLDGSQLFFYSNREGPWYGWSVRIDGSGLTQVTAGEEDANWLRPSYDGRRLAYISDRGARIANLGDGLPLTRSEPLPDTPNAQFVPRSWSPDGKWLAGAPWGVAASGLYVYSFADQRLHDLNVPAQTSAFIDDRRILFIDEADAVGIVDIVTRSVRHIGRLPPPADPDGARTETVSLSNDGRFMLVYRTRVESDIWQMSAAATAGSK
ncbi:MAG: hypothetical protein WD227_16675 [Vicinamibacterales bacterium]